MKTLLEKLDRQAGCWLDSLEQSLHQPITRVITGQVFVDVGSVNSPKEQQIARSATTPNAQSHEASAYRSSTLAEVCQQECGSAA